MMKPHGETMPDEIPEPAKSDPDWFRQPTPREHRIGAALFIGFGLFFIAMFIVLSGWWFRWVMIALAGYSMLEGIRHFNDAWMDEGDQRGS